LADEALATEALAVATGLGLAVQTALCRLVAMLEARRLFSGEDVANDFEALSDFLVAKPTDAHSPMVAAFLSGLASSLRADRRFGGPPRSSAPAFKLRAIDGGRNGAA
jgi:hypothetical protein